MYAIKASLKVQEELEYSMKAIPTVSKTKRFHFLNSYNSNSQSVNHPTSKMIKRKLPKQTYKHSKQIK
jgi:hypothetical protein